MPAKKQNMMIYQSKSGAIELKGDVVKETVWATQEQIADIFGIERSVVTKHIRNILKDGELDVNSVRAKFARTALDGKTYQVQSYNLDIMLAVGYRTNSARAIQFRQWATKTLKQHIVEGYTINKKQLAKNYDAFLKAVGDVKKLLPSSSSIKAQDALALIQLFATTWLSLDAYDKSTLPEQGITKRKLNITSEQLSSALVKLKMDLIKKNQATDFFAREKQENALQGIMGNIFQSFGGQDVYPTVEEKAAHLLYFVIKNHPFVDGNKRSGAFAFVWFLQKAKLLDNQRLTPEALTALTLLIAESQPTDKQRMIGLVLMLLKPKKSEK